MKTERIYLNKNQSAWIDQYILDDSIGYKLQRSWPVMIIVPGGAYLTVATREGEAVALEYLKMGYSCFVLHYAPYIADRETGQRDEQAHYPSQEIYLMETLHIIHQNADKWHLDDKQIFATGFSAGAHIVGMVATRLNDPYYISKLSFIPSNDELRLKGIVLCYPMLNGDNHSDFMQSDDPNIQKLREDVDVALYGHNDPTQGEIDELDLINYISKDCCPVFLWHTTDDKVVPSICSTELIHKLQSYSIPCEYHLFHKGVHGLSTMNKSYSHLGEKDNLHLKSWITLVEYWLEEIREEG